MNKKRLLFLGAVGGAITALLALAPQPAVATVGESASGSGQTVQWNFSFTALGGAGVTGAGATGSMTFHDIPSGLTAIADVRCLYISVNRATIVGLITESTVTGGLESVGHQMIFYVEDNGTPGAGNDRWIAFFGTHSETNCTDLSGGYTIQTGEIVVQGLPVLHGPPEVLTLSPAADTNTVGEIHTVRATVTDTLGNPTPNVVVRFSISGSVTASGSCTTGPSGVCGFSYIGPPLPGADLIGAYADTNADGVQDADEPSGGATKAWVLPSSTPGQVDGGGQIDVGGKRIAFGFSARNGNNGFQGSCNVVDQSADMIVRCVDVTVLVISGNAATVFGNATVNGVATTYRIDAVDNANPGRGADIFSIQTGNGYSRSGVLTGGNVHVKD